MEEMGTRATISIKRKEGGYQQLWYVNSDGSPKVLGQEIYNFLKTPDDVERAHAIFQNNKCGSFLETDFTLGKIENLGPILKQYNDYAYVLEEETGYWGLYEYDKNELFCLKEKISA
ncbi:MAG: hypothetical protein LBC70_08400 [Chitinispirillales bacterium]|jgi:hypothetical protein|nr:hypothetical protein [Chitinispirillales bacterium]